MEYHRARNLNPTAEGFHYHHMVKSIDIGWLKLWKRCSQKVRISPKGRVFLRIQVLSRFTERFQQKASEENSTKKSMLSERFLRSQPTSATLASSKSKILFIVHIRFYRCLQRFLGRLGHGKLSEGPNVSVESLTQWFPSVHFHVIHLKSGPTLHLEIFSFSP